ncbi:MAG TPA: hypothetical protein VH186_11670 [Chloroflexia bacterium]|nr:hypothetical protein [Chloroflexia bacterium]
MEILIGLMLILAFFATIHIDRQRRNSSSSQVEQESDLDSLFDAF